MKRRILWVAATVLIMGAGLPLAGRALTITQHGIMVTNPYSYSTAATQKHGAIFMHIENNTRDNHRITRVETDIAERVELHTHIMEDGKVQMRQVSELPIPATKGVWLQPRGDHIMLFDLKRQLKEGEFYPVTLHFADRKPMSFKVEVVTPGYNPFNDPVRKSHNTIHGDGESGDHGHDDHSAQGEHGTQGAHGEDSGHTEHGEHNEHGHH